jgi:hypothetical protein
VKTKTPKSKPVVTKERTIDHPDIGATAYYWHQLQGSGKYKPWLRILQRGRTIFHQEYANTGERTRAATAWLQDEYEVWQKREADNAHCRELRKRNRASLFAGFLGICRLFSLVGGSRAKTPTVKVQQWDT